MYATTMLTVRDVEASSAWYRRLLGCTSGHGGKDIEFLMDGEELMLMLHRLEAHDHAFSPAEGEPVGVGVCVFIRVPDIRLHEARATEMGLAHKGVQTNPLGHQEELELRDPDGYYVTLCGPASWAKAP